MLISLISRMIAIKPTKTVPIPMQTTKTPETSGMVVPPFTSIYDNTRDGLLLKANSNAFYQITYHDTTF